LQVGYCGADLKALCSEAVLISIRETFPHIYLSTDRLDIEFSKLAIRRQHFTDAMRHIVPVLPDIITL